MGKVIRPFCWHQNFVPWGLSAPAPGLYRCIKTWKICIQSDFKDIFFKLATNEWSDKTFLFTSKLCPLGAVCPCPGGLYTCIKSWTKLYKIRLQRYIFETWNKWPKWQYVPVDIKISFPRGCQPCPGAIFTCIKSWKKLDKIRLQRDFFETCSKWPKWQEVSVDIKILSHGVVCPLTCSYIHLLNHEKMCIKSEVEEILFELEQMTIVMRPSCWHQN